MGSVIRKAVKMPQSLPSVGMLQMKGLSVMGACTYSEIKTGRMYLQDHVILVVLEGIYIVRYGDQEYPVRKNEMALLHKGIAIEYEKYGEENSGHVLDYMMFFLKDELLHEFMKISSFSSSQPAPSAPTAVHSVNERLLSYVASLKPYFEEPEAIQDELIKLKMLELLFDILDADKGLLNPNSAVEAATPDKHCRGGGAESAKPRIASGSGLSVRQKLIDLQTGISEDL
jgi:hypothetical protein